MKNLQLLRRTVALLALAGCINALCLMSGRAADHDAAPKSAPSVVRVAPPAPVFAPAQRLAELASRRARVAERIGPKSILVLFSGEPRVYANDVDYEFRQENNLYYLTSLKQQGATLVLLPGNAALPEVLFLPRRDPSRETWTGHMYSPEEARAVSGIRDVWDAKEFEPFMRALRTRRAYRPDAHALFLSSTVAPEPSVATIPPNEAANTPTGYENLFSAMMANDASLYLLVPGGDGESREYAQEQKFAARWAQSATGFNVRNAWPIFVEMRQRKSPMELALMQHAIDISIEGHERAQSVAAQSQWEYEIEAEVDYTYKRRNADNWGYPNIVGCGPNATTLHYQESQGRVKPGDLLLMDAGAEYEHYSADVTRTFPVSGRFSPAQAEVYNLVLAAQEAAFKAIRTGATIGDVHSAAAEVIKDGLLKLGLITDRNSDQYRLYFMHGTSHWLGMNVHDVGARGGKLEPGMVFTVEPGVYVRGDALDNLPDTPENRKFAAAVRPAFERYKNIGVRIEDDVLMTPEGFRNLSGALPRTIPDIEAFMAHAASH